MSNEYIYATPAQENYIRRLVIQAQASRCLPHPVSRDRRLSKADASRLIDTLKAALEDAKNGASRIEDERKAERAARAARGGSIGDGFEMGTSYCDATRSYRVAARSLAANGRGSGFWTNCGTVGWGGMPATEIQALAVELANGWIASGLVE